MVMRIGATVVAIAMLVGVGVGCGPDSIAGDGGGGAGATSTGGVGPTTSAATRPATTRADGSEVSAASVLPATTLFVRPDTDAAGVESVPLVEVTEPCPVSDPSGARGAGVGAEVARLEPMLGKVLAYGGQHADEFGGYGLVWHGADDASVVISFATDVDVHRAALSGMVEHPDELVVCQVAVSGVVAEAIEATLIVDLRGRFSSIGGGLGGIEVVLAADEEALAADLDRRYGDAIELRVGALSYPLNTATSVCPDLPVEASLPGLEIAIVSPAEPLTAGGVEPLQLAVMLTNVGRTPIRFGSGTATGTILDSDGRVVAGPGTVAIGDVGIGVDLAPGESTELPMVASTASCDPRLGYELPPGDYQIVGHVQHSDGTPTQLISPPLPIVIGS